MGKRGQNEGSIHKRADGRWCATIHLGWKDGKRQRKSFYGKTRHEVAEKLSAALSDRAKGLPVAVDRQSVGQFLDDWLEHSVKPRVRPKTFTSYSQLVRLHIIPAVGKLKLSKLTPQHVQTLLNDKLATGLSARTVQYIHAVLRSALNQALRWGLVARNVATLVDAPRVERHEFLYFTPDEARCFLDAVRGDRLEALYGVAMALGLRQAEALGLRWEDVNLDTGLLRVSGQLQWISGKSVITPTKTARSRRTIPLPAVTIDALRQHRVRQLEEKLAAGGAWRNELGLVFTTSLGTPLDARNVRRWFGKLLRSADLPALRFHDLRHTSATLLLAQGVSHRMIMETLGHSQISLTMNTYAHVTLPMQQEAANLMDAILTIAH